MKSLIVWMIILVLVVTGAIWWVKSMGRDVYCSLPLISYSCKVSREEEKEKFDDKQLRCFIAILEVDTRKAKLGKRQKAQNYVARVILRDRDSTRPIDKSGKKGQPAVEFCDIWSEGHTIYPKGWETTWWFRTIGRRLGATEFSPRTKGWDEAKKRALEAIERGPDPNLCATRYVRPNPDYTAFTNELEAQEEIRKNMRRDPHIDQDTGLEFFCP